MVERATLLGHCCGLQSAPVTILSSAGHYRGRTLASQIITQRQHGIASITMDGCGKANTIDVSLCEQLLRALHEIDANETDRVVILRSAGGIFCAGGDLVQILNALDAPADELAILIDSFHQVILTMRSLPIPILASVGGAAAGAGFSLALACDAVVASSEARFVAGYPAIGTSSDGGLSYHLARRIGSARAINTLLLKNSLDAQEALQIGLVQHIAEPGFIDTDAIALATRLAALPVCAVREFKALIGTVSDRGLREHLQLEKEAFLRCAATEPFRQKIEDFVGRSSEGKKPMVQ
jgi:2-(1,2-epoxy-1,2-dihydrophenyl)acetyl-CoA isomerase